jgi:chemotaxis protein MotA
MNFSAITGIILAFVVALITAVTSTDSYTVFLDYHAFTIVIGGTFAASLLSFSGKKLWLLTKIFIKRVLFKNEEVNQAVNEIVDLATGFRNDENYLQSKVSEIKTHFLREAIQMLCDGGIEPKDMDAILRKRANSIYHHHEEDAEIFKSLAKFPPAFGLLGAVIGMVAMMQSLGGADSMSKVGPALAVALVATLYGIAIANFIFLPIGENLAKVNRVDSVIREMVIDGVKLIRAKKHPLVVNEMICSHLLPSDRPQKEQKAA